MVVTVQHPGVIIKAQQHNLTSGLILPLIQFFCIGECGKERLSITRFQQRKGHLGVFWQLDSSIFVRFRSVFANFNLSRCKEYTAHHQVDNRIKVLRIVFLTQGRSSLFQRCIINFRRFGCCRGCILCRGRILFLFAHDILLLVWVAAHTLLFIDFDCIDGFPQVCNAHQA